MNAINGGNPTITDPEDEKNGGEPAAEDSPAAANATKNETDSEA
jgi:hypothetical protein